MEDVLLASDWPNAQVSYDGTVVHNYPSMNKLACPFNVDKFPFDEQYCTQTLQVANYRINEVIVHGGMRVLRSNVSSGRGC
jgi:hypothetical protein